MITKELQKTNIAKIEKKKGGKVKIGDIVKVETEQYSGWISIIGQVKSINEKEIKVLTVKPDAYSGARIELFETELNNDKFKLHFAEKEELNAIIFKVKQEALHKLQERQKELQDAENKYANTIEDVKNFKI